MDRLNNADLSEEDAEFAGVWPTYMQSDEVQRLCALGLRVTEWAEDRLYEVGVVPSSADHLALTAFAVVHEHHKSCVLLVEEGLFASAAALMRPALEAYFRGLWLQWAEELELQRFQEGKDSLDPQRFIRQLVRKSKVQRYGNLLPMWEQSKKTLHGHVHHGYQSLVRRSGEFEVTPEEVATMLKFSTDLALHASLDFTELVGRKPVAGIDINQRRLVNDLQREIAAFMCALDLATLK